MPTILTILKNVFSSLYSITFKYNSTVIQDIFTGRIKDLNVNKH